MKKLILLFILLFGCSSSTPEPTTAWDKINHLEVDGIVEITTAWGKSHLCTGSLIQNNIILTAAHCAVFPVEDMFIVYGCDNINQSSCKKVPVVRKYQHPKWKKEFIAAHDIAILIPEIPIPLTLAEIYTKKNIPEGLSVKAVGFGQRNSDSGVLYSGRGRVTRDYKYELVAHMRGSLDPNPGDSGGPALILEDGKFKIAGILSRSRWTDVSKKKTFIHSGYAIYTKPIEYLNWIYEISYNEECGFL